MMTNEEATEENTRAARERGKREAVEWQKMVMGHWGPSVSEKFRANAADIALVDKGAAREIAIFVAAMDRIVGYYTARMGTGDKSG